MHTFYGSSNVMRITVAALSLLGKWRRELLKPDWGSALGGKDSPPWISEGPVGRARGPPRVWLYSFLSRERIKVELAPGQPAKDTTSCELVCP